MLEIGGIRVNIPPGALGEDVTIAVTEYEVMAQAKPAPAGYEFASHVYELEPHGQSFALDVNIQIDLYPGVSATEVGRASETGQFTFVPTTLIDDQVAVFSTPAFSYYAVFAGGGDPTTGDGDGDPSTGDGDGDPTTGDGDGDPTAGDGDGDTIEACGDGVVVGSCNPIDQDCAQGESCYFDGVDFQCAATGSSAAGEDCTLNSCAKGLSCLAASDVPGCPGGFCCAEICNLDCGGCSVPEATCTPLFEPGNEPVGGTNVGFCLNVADGFCGDSAISGYEECEPDGLHDCADFGYPDGGDNLSCHPAYCLFQTDACCAGQCYADRDACQELCMGDGTCIGVCNATFAACFDACSNDCRTLCLNGYAACDQACSSNYTQCQDACFNDPNCQLACIEEDKQCEAQCSMDAFACVGACN